jgi:hypothetical protein
VVAAVSEMRVTTDPTEVHADPVYSAEFVTGDYVEAHSLQAILMAVSTICDDNDNQELRRDVIVKCRGEYDGSATCMAQEGWAG